MNTGKFSMRELVMSIAGNRHPRESMDDVLRRVAKAAGLSPRAVRGVWHREPNISFETARRLKIAAEKKQNEQQQIIDQLETLAARLETNDADFHRAHVDFLRALAAERRGDFGKKE